MSLWDNERSLLNGIGVTNLIILSITIQSAKNISTLRSPNLRHLEVWVLLILGVILFEHIALIEWLVARYPTVVTCAGSICLWMIFHFLQPYYFLICWKPKNLFRDHIPQKRGSRSPFSLSLAHTHARTKSKAVIWLDIPTTEVVRSKRSAKDMKINCHWKSIYIFFLDRYHWKSI